MDAEFLFGSLLKGVLTSRSRRKRAGGLMRYVLGNRGSVGGVMMLGGLAYALFESLSKQSGASPAPTFGTTPHDVPRVVPPPLPNTPVSAAHAAPPAVLPTVPPTPVPSAPETPAPVSEDVLRVIRLSISAARADGRFTDAERDAILSQARAVGAEAIVSRDLDEPRPMDEILAGVHGDAHREQLYSIAFAIVRADEQVSDVERHYLNDVATTLALPAATVTRLESQAAESITAAGRSGDDH